MIIFITTLVKWLWTVNLRPAKLNFATDGVQKSANNFAEILANEYREKIVSGGVQRNSKGGGEY